MARETIHVAGPAGPVEQTCARCGVVLIDGVPHVEGRVYRAAADGGERVNAPTFFQPGLSIAVLGGGMWTTSEEPTCGG